MRIRRYDEARDSDMAELTALADESLAPARRAVLEARVAACSELADRLAEQRRAVTLLQNAAAEIEAPVTLRERVENRSPSSGR